MSYKDDVAQRYQKEQLPLVPDLANCTLRLELTNICNHTCVFCPHSMQMRKKGYMDKVLAKRLLCEAYELGVRRVALFMNGEPFMAKGLEEYIRYSKELGYEYVFITTNASFATEERIMSVMDAGIDSIKFSINAGTPESYLKIHGEDGYEKAMARLCFANEYRKKKNIPCRLLAGFVVTDLTIPEMQQQYDRVAPLVDDILFFKPDNFGGYMVERYKEYLTKPIMTDLPFYDYPDKCTPCSLLFNSVNITYEGYLTLCCSEALNMMVTCDLNTMTLADAWSSDIMKGIRRKHLENQLEGTQCYKCMYNVSAEVKPLNEELYFKSIK